MNLPVYKNCPNCKKQVILSFKRRDRPGYCSLKCAYADRILIPKKKVCQLCRKIFYRKGKGKFCSNTCKSMGYVGFKHKETTKAKMKAAWTRSRRRSVTIPLVKMECKYCGYLFSVKVKGKGSRRVVCSETCRVGMLCSDNHMKRPEMRKKISDAAKNRGEGTRKKIGEGVSRAWAEGKFKNARVGKCYWYAFVSKSGITYKVQGTWELAFINWLDQSGVEFECHKGRIPYVDSSGNQSNWYPDFRLVEKDIWVDIKCEHFYDEVKFDLIREFNPDLVVSVLFLEDLKELGINVNDKELKELATNCKVS